jgi:hypothetical protein
MHLEPEHHTIVAMDVAGSGHRDDLLQLRMRADLREIVAETLATQSLDLDLLPQTDLGDGIRLMIERVSPVALLDPFVPNLAAALRRHRKTASHAARLRLRIAITTGLLHRDGGGWAGAPLVECARMLDAAPVRQAMAADDHADLVLVVSRAVYEGVVRHGYGPDPDTFHPVDIAEKETRTTVWIHVPGYRVSPGRGNDLPAVAVVEQADRPAGGAVFHVHAARDAYTAQRMTVIQHDGAVGPEVSP